MRCANTAEEEREGEKEASQADERGRYGCRWRGSRKEGREKEGVRQ